MDDDGTSTKSDEAYTRKRVVLITGCSSGIGQATAEAFLDEDWQVVATARDLNTIADLAEQGCRTRSLDVTNGEQVARLVEETIDDLGAIDCLVNNAGYGQKGPIEDISPADLHRQFDVNVYGPHRLIRAVLPHMRAQGEGRIVNVSSIQGLVSFAGTGVYAGSKHALEAMTEALRTEVGPLGIDVSLVEPGPVETAFDDRAMAELPVDRTLDYEWLYKLHEDSQYLGGVSPLASPPSEVADAIVHAATCPGPQARYPVGPVARYGRFARFLPERIRDLGLRVLRKVS
ncbi:MAG: SDR family oxidoreductase [Natrialbaceae archaeon]|nr:SDR family oxidoreductase [Natrialbaceae archaeon]